MLRRTISVILVAAVAALGVYWWLTTPAAFAVPLLPRAPDLANGQEIFNVGGCSSCHAVPNQADRLRLGGGLALGSPFGRSTPPIFRPIRPTASAAGARADFVNAVMRGVSPDGRRITSRRFPTPSYHLAKVDDVRDLFAYLKTLPPVAGKSRDHDVPFPFNIRRNVGIWKLLFMNTSPFVPDATRSAQWNRGAYLVNGFGHCAECHSPRNFLGGIITAQRLAGGPNPEGEGWVPNITQKGIGTWSEKDIADFLETGDMPEGDSASGAMRPVIKNLARLTAEDRAAMAAYLEVAAAGRWADAAQARQIGVAGSRRTP